MFGSPRHLYYTDIDTSSCLLGTGYPKKKLAVAGNASLVTWVSFALAKTKHRSGHVACRVERRTVSSNIHPGRVKSAVTAIPTEETQGWYVRSVQLPRMHWKRPKQCNWQIASKYSFIFPESVSHFPQPSSCGGRAFEGCETKRIRWIVKWWWTIQDTRDSSACSPHDFIKWCRLYCVGIANGEVIVRMNGFI